MASYPHPAGPEARSAACDRVHPGAFIWGQAYGSHRIGRAWGKQSPLCHDANFQDLRPWLLSCAYLPEPERRHPIAGRGSTCLPVAPGIEAGLGSVCHNSDLTASKALAV